MSTNFPSALDIFTNPNGSDSLNAAAVPHAEQHANANDAIEALQAKVGINGSAVATSLDYRISAAETGLDGKISSSEKGSANGVATLGFDGKVPSSQLPPLDYIPTSAKGAAGGVAGLDEAGKVPAAQLPSYVDDVLEYANLAAFPVTGEAGKIYVALDTNKTYRWSVRRMSISPLVPLIPWREKPAWFRWSRLTLAWVTWITPAMPTSQSVQRHRQP